MPSRPGARGRRPTSGRRRGLPGGVWLRSALVACALARSAAAFRTPTRPAAAPEGDALSCGVRALAAELAGELLQGGTPRGLEAAQRDVADALRLGDCSGRGEVRPAQAARPAPGAAGAGDAGGALLHVDPSRHARGSFGTLAEALAAAAALPAGEAATVVLAPATHRVPRGGLVLTAAHSGARIVGETGARGERAAISGAVPLEGLRWRKVDTQPVPAAAAPSASVWVATLPEGAPAPESALRVAGRRFWRARFPNSEAGVDVPDKRISGSHPAVSWLPPITPAIPSLNLGIATPNRSALAEGTGLFETYRVGVGGECAVYDPPSSYWCADQPQGGGATRFTLPAGLAITAANVSDVLPNAAASGGYSAAPSVNTWRPYRWANWMFDAAGATPVSGAQGLRIDFARGGYQGARGAQTGGDWFVEALEELDQAGEFWYAAPSRELYVVVNGTTAPADGSVEAVFATRLLTIAGTSNAPVVDFSLLGVDVVDAAPTYMSPHGVPSGGDWALERDAAVIAEDVVRLRVDDVTFTRLEGNAVMLSGYCRDAAVTRSEFSWIGGTAIASWGRAELMDGTAGRQPWGTLVEGNLFREIGLHEKQSAFVFQALTANATIRGNVGFNAPRAGINLNDGFAGGHRLDRNLLFNTCRESGDHGVINTWDRQPFLWLDPAAAPGGAPSLVPRTTHIAGNLFLGGYQADQGVDNDDGSAFYQTSSNVMYDFRSGLKSDWGGHDNNQTGNLFLWHSSCVGISQPQGTGGRDVFAHNRCVMAADGIYARLICNSPSELMPAMAQNQVYSPGANVTVCGVPLAEWQQRTGMDAGTTVAKTPTTDEMLGWARDMLELQEERRRPRATAVWRRASAVV